MASSRARRAGSNDKGRPKAASVRKLSRAVTTPPKTVDDLFGGGYGGRLLSGEFHTEAIYAWFQRRHAKGANLVVDDEGYYRRNGHEWQVPLGVREALRQPLRASQVGTQYPWYVTWRSPRDGTRKRKSFNALAQAIVFVAERAQYADDKACIVSRHGYDIPRQLRNRIPKPWKWCPCCMKPRKYHRVYNRHGDPVVFYGPLKVWREAKPSERKYYKGGGYWATEDRKLALMRCEVCELTNRDFRFRRSNQPFHTVKVKRGKTRVKRTRRRRNG